MERVRVVVCGGKMIDRVGLKQILEHQVKKFTLQHHKLLLNIEVPGSLA